MLTSKIVKDVSAKCLSRMIKMISLIFRRSKVKVSVTSPLSYICERNISALGKINNFVEACDSDGCKSDAANFQIHS